VTPTNQATVEPSTESSLRDQLEALRNERDTHYDRWMRAQAELENFRRRARKEADELHQYQALPLARDLLPALDNLQRAIQAANAAVANAASDVEWKQLVEGLDLVARQFLDILAKHNVQPIQTGNQTFDPARHEAVAQIPSSDRPPMTILEEIEPGYMLHDRVVRPAKVMVASAAPEPVAEPESSKEPDASDESS